MEVACVCVTIDRKMKVLGRKTSTKYMRASSGNPLVVQWLGLPGSPAGGLGSISGQGTKIPQAARPKKKHLLTHQSGQS